MTINNITINSLRECYSSVPTPFSHNTAFVDYDFRDVPKFRRVVATADRGCSIECVYAFSRGDFVLVGD